MPRKKRGPQDKLKRRQEALGKAMGMVFKRIEKASVALACRDAASCDLGPRIGERDTEDLKIIIRCSAGCVRAYDRVDFDKAAVDAVHSGSNGGPPDPRWVILGPLLRGKPCLACRRGSLQYAASFTPNRVFQQWILDPCVVMRTVNQTLPVPVPPKVKYKDSRVLWAWPEPCCIDPLCPSASQLQARAKGSIRWTLRARPKTSYNAMQQQDEKMSSRHKKILQDLAICTRAAIADTVAIRRSIPLVAVVGPTGSGKSSFLDEFRGKLEAVTEPQWDPTRTIMSQFKSGPRHRAISWLGSVALNAIPSWCQPYHALSTGQRYRARLARVLESATRDGTGAIFDDFAQHLDPDSARCVSAALQRLCKRAEHSEKIPWVVVATSHSSRAVMTWLQPDIVVRLGPGEPSIFKPERAGRKPRVMITVSPGMPPAVPAPAPAVGTAVQTSTWKRGDSCAGERVVLCARAVPDESTRLCDAYFDTPFDGITSTQLPGFPTREDLGHFRLALILGPSGSSKSVLARHAFGGHSRVEWADDTPVEGHFHSIGSANRFFDIVQLPRSARGRTYTMLSAGQRAAADLARVLEAREINIKNSAEGVGCAVVDEYTSAMDRDMARRVCRGISALIAREREQNNVFIPIILVTCHPDVLGAGALAPDWVYDTAQNTLTWYRQTTATSDQKSAAEFLNGRAEIVSPEWFALPPVLDLSLHPCTHSEWQYFAKHHYKSTQLSKRAEARVLVDKSSGVRVGFVATLPHSNAGQGNAFRAHRTVVLPSWQGMGIGSRLSDAGGEVHRRRGHRYYGQTVHPRFGSYRDKSPLWRGLAWNHAVQTTVFDTWKHIKEHVQTRLRQPRVMYAHEYVGARDTATLRHLSARVRFAEDDDDSSDDRQDEKE